VITLPATVAIRAAAQDPDGEVARVTFYLNGKAVGEATVRLRMVWSTRPAAGTP